MRYFVYFFNITTNTPGGMVYENAHIATGEDKVPSWKEVQKRLAFHKGIHKGDVAMTGFYEFANEQDYKDFCG